MLIFRREKKPHHTELRLEKYWDDHSAAEHYRLVEYNFDKKDRLIKDSEYSWRGSGDKKWADVTSRHYGIKVTPPLLDEKEY